MTKIPNNVTESVSLLLQPYGVDFREILKQVQENFGKIEPRYMTPTQASQYCGLSPKTIRDKALAGEIDSTRLGNSEKSRVLIVKNSLDAWLEGQAMSI